MREGRADSPRERTLFREGAGSPTANWGRGGGRTGASARGDAPGDVRVAEPANNDAEQSRRHGGVEHGISGSTESEAVIYFVERAPTATTCRQREVNVLEGPGPSPILTLAIIRAA